MRETAAQLGVQTSSSRAITKRWRIKSQVIGTALVACLAYARHYDADRAICTDIRYYLYFAQQTSRGAVPDVDFFDIKTPLATFVGALLYRVAEIAGMEPLSVVRFAYLAFAAAIALCAFVVHKRI